MWDGLGYFDYIFLPHYKSDHKETYHRNGNNKRTIWKSLTKSSSEDTANFSHTHLINLGKKYF